VGNVVVVVLGGRVVVVLLGGRVVVVVDGGRVVVVVVGGRVVVVVVPEPALITLPDGSMTSPVSAQVLFSHVTGPSNEESP